MKSVEPAKLQALANDLVAGIGAKPDEVAVVALHLVQSNLCGHDSHGVIRIPQYHAHAKEGRLRLDQTIDVERETPATAVIDGHWTWGQVVAQRGIDLAIAKAKQSSLGAVAIRRCYHVGRVGVYALRAAEQGFICKIWCNGHGVVRVAPWGGTQPRMGTNPIAIAIPTGKEPILVDITTSVVAEGKVRVARNQGRSVPAGWLLDKSGQPTTNPADLYDGGSLLPIGGDVGHKGFALSLVVDLLGGALTGAGCGAMPGVPIGNGLWIEVANPEAFDRRDAFLSRVDAFLEYVQSSPPRPEVERILLPGEPERQIERQRRRDGVPLDDETRRQLLGVAKEIGVAIEEFLA